MIGTSAARLLTPGESQGDSKIPKISEALRSPEGRISMVLRALVGASITSGVGGDDAVLANPHTQYFTNHIFMSTQISNVL